MNHDHERSQTKFTSLSCGTYNLPLHERTLIMGILNVTPDSFSDGGRYNQLDDAMRHAERLVKDGADIIDVGGESTRPGSQLVSAEQELERIIPIIERLSRDIDVRIPVATWNVPIILMHNREQMEYQDFFPDYIKDLQESIQLALAAGVSEEMIVLDPGIGFAKTLQQNLEAMRRLDDLVALGYPVLLGTSRKSMIGKVLDLPVDERLEGTIATVALGIEKGCHIMRVHDVKAIKRTAMMMDAIKKGARYNG